MSWGPYASCPDLSGVGFADSVPADPPRSGAVKCSYPGNPTLLVEYYPDGYADYRQSLFDFDYTQGGGATEWPAFGEGAVRSSSGDESLGSCTFLLPSSPERAYVTVSAVLDPGEESYCDVAAKAATTLSAASATTLTERPTANRGAVLASATSKNFDLRFEIAEHPFSDATQVTKSKFALSRLTLQATASRSGPRVTITVTPSARGTYTLVSAPHRFTVFRSELTASPLWEKDSLFCREAIPKQSNQPIDEVVNRQAVAPIGISTAASYADLQRYPSAPYCGLNWRGYSIDGDNVEVREGGNLPLLGEQASFDVVTSPDLADAVMREALAPAGWAFMYGEQPVNVPDNCPDLATGPVGFSTVDLC